MAATQAHTEEFPPPTPAPPELIARASALVTNNPQCFGFSHHRVRVESLGDVRLVIEHLRKHGDQRAWWDAQDLHRCLSPLLKRKS